METSTPGISFPIYIDYERQRIVPQYVHISFETLNNIINNISDTSIIPDDPLSVLLPRKVFIDPITGKEEVFKDNKWSANEYTLFLEYLSVNFHQWQFNKNEFYRWLSKKVFKDLYTEQVFADK